MRRMLFAIAGLLVLAAPPAAQAQSDDQTQPGTTLGTGPARGSDKDSVKPVPGPGMTTGDSSEGRSGSAPSSPRDITSGSARPSSDHQPDMTEVPRTPPHGGSSSSGIGGGSTAPGRSSGENSPAGRM